MSNIGEFLSALFVTKIVAFEGIVLQLLIFNKLRRYALRSRIVSFIQMLGGAMVIFSYTFQVENLTGLQKSPMFVVSAVGLFLVAYPFFYYKTVKVRTECLIQLIVLLFSPVLILLGGVSLSFLLPGFFLLMAMFFAIRASLWLKLHTPFTRLLLRLASWIMVGSSWLLQLAVRTHISCIHYYILLVYFAALVFWVYSLGKMYEHLRRWA